MMRLLVLLIFFVFATLTPHSYEAEFTGFYNRRAWGRNARGEGCSGANSTVENAQPYMKFLQDFLTEYNIESVVDAGCGDWEFSRLMNWDGIDYKGYDVVRHVILNNKRNYETANIKFFHADILSTDLPEADLLICRDVLQHLNYPANIEFLSKLGKYKYCLITNNMEFIRLLEDPYSVRGIEAFRYVVDGTQIIQVVLIGNTKK